MVVAHNFVNELQRAVKQGLLIIALTLVISLMVNQLRYNSMPIVGQWSISEVITPSGTDISIPLQDAEKLFLAGSVLFLDARPPEEFEQGHIKGAVNLPWLQFDEYAEKILPKITPDMTVICYCDGETCTLGKDLAFSLIEFEFLNIRVLVDGWTTWQEEGLPTERLPQEL